MTKSINEIWDKIISLADELECFDPGLTGLADELKSLKFKKEYSSSNWFARNSQKLSNEALVEVAFGLNSIAGQLFSNDEADAAKAVGTFSYELYKAVLGEEHESTKMISNNLMRLERKQQSGTLPKLKAFKRK